MSPRGKSSAVGEWYFTQAIPNVLKVPSPGRTAHRRIAHLCRRCNVICIRQGDDSAPHPQSHDLALHWICHTSALPHPRLGPWTRGRGGQREGRRNSSDATLAMGIFSSLESWGFIWGAYSTKPKPDQLTLWIRQRTPLPRVQ